MPATTVVDQDAFAALLAKKLPQAVDDGLHEQPILAAHQVYVADVALHHELRADRQVLRQLAQPAGKRVEVQRRRMRFRCRSFLIRLRGLDARRLPARRMRSMGLR